MAGNRRRSSGPTTRRTPPTTANLCPVFAIYQIRALAMGRVLPTIYTEDEARAALAALMSEIFDALRTSLVQHPGNPTMP